MRFIVGLLIAAAGAALDFWPIGSVTSGSPPSISFWLAHELCSTGIGDLGQFFSGDVASSCSTVSILWLAGLASMAIGSIVVLSSLLGLGTPPGATRTARPPHEPAQTVPPATPLPSATQDEMGTPPSSAAAGVEAEPLRPLRRSRRAGLAIAIPVVVLVGAVAIATWGPQNGQSEVPVVGCATTYGSSAPAAALLPATDAEPFLTAATASQLARYVSADASYSQLAPRGWICTAGEGADGGWGLSIHPLTDPSATVTLDGEANGQGFQMACDLFPAAASDAPVPSSCSVPSQEVIDRKSSTLVLFSDPPGVVGTGQRSGAYTVIGAMTFEPSAYGATTRVLCALPDSQRNLCETTVDATVAAWQGQK